MKIKFLFFAVTLLFLNKADCQKSDMKFGVYESGITSTIEGYWVLKHDSTFIFIKFEGNNAKYIGNGKWMLEKDSMIKFTFNNELLPILQNVTFQYAAETKSPFDSIFIKGRIKDQANNNIQQASIIINGTYHIISDTSGLFNISLPRSFSPQNLKIVKKIFDYEIVELKLNPNVNFHQLNIIIPKSDSLTCYSAYDSNSLTQTLLYKKELLYRYYNTPVVKKKHNSISFLSEDRNVLLDKLLKAREIQSLYQSNLKQLFDLINK
jgi:hypothetical protein